MTYFSNLILLIWICLNTATAATYYIQQKHFELLTFIIIVLYSLTQKILLFYKFEN